MATLYQDDGRVLDYTPDADVTAGDVVVVGDRALVADRDIAAGELGGLAGRGVYKFTRAATSGASITNGTIMYWDGDEEEPITSDEGSTIDGKLGYAFGDLVATDTEWLIELSP